MKTINNSFELTSAYLSPQIVFPFYGKTKFFGKVIFLLILQLKVFQKQIKLSIDAVTR